MEAQSADRATGQGGGGRRGGMADRADRIYLDRRTSHDGRSSPFTYVCAPFARHVGILLFGRQG